MEQTSVASFYEIRSSDDAVLKRDGGFATQDTAKIARADSAGLAPLKSAFSFSWIALVLHGKRDNQILVPLKYATGDRLIDGIDRS